MTKRIAACPLNMNSNEAPRVEAHELLAQELAQRVVKMGRLAPHSEGLVQAIENFRSASDDQLEGLIAACDQRIAHPPCCG